MIALRPDRHLANSDRPAQPSSVADAILTLRIPQLGDLKVSGGTSLATKILVGRCPGYGCAAKRLDSASFHVLPRRWALNMAFIWLVSSSILPVATRDPAPCRNHDPR